MLPQPLAPVECLQIATLIHSQNVRDVAGIHAERVRSGIIANRFILRSCDGFERGGYRYYAEGQTQYNTGEQQTAKPVYAGAGAKS